MDPRRRSNRALEYQKKGKQEQKQPLKRLWDEGTIQMASIQSFSQSAGQGTQRSSRGQCCLVQVQSEPVSAPKCPNALRQHERKGAYVTAREEERETWNDRETGSACLEPRSLSR